MKKYIPAACLISAILFTTIAVKAVVMTDPHGRWPSDWPKALEPLRDHARTIDVASGTQENIYEITFKDRTEFEKAWPSIVSLKTYGAPLRLYKVGTAPPDGFDQLESNSAPTVRIYAPSNSEASGPDGQKLKASAPWPNELYGPNGELPEFVHAETHDGKLRWIAVDPANDNFPGFHHRARIDIDLVIDGQIIDLNRISLPSNTPIEDHRF